MQAFDNSGFFQMSEASYNEGAHQVSWHSVGNLVKFARFRRNALPMRNQLLFAFFFSWVSGPLFGQSEPPALICGVWPDRILFFDQMTEKFTEGFRLGHGAITGSGLSGDKRRLFVVTNRMESVEIIDPIQRKVVDVFKLSGAYRRVRIRGVFPDRDGSKVYLTVSVVNRGVDRFEREDGVDIVAYDVVNDEVIEEFTLSPKIRGNRGVRIHVAPDGKSFYVISSDIHQIDAETHEVMDTVVLSEPLLAGYGPVRGLSLTETEPGVFYGIYRTTDPFLKKEVFGVAELDLYGKNIRTFELGPDANVRRFAVSPDGRRGYAGLHDLVVVDMDEEKVILQKDDFEQGRTNTSMIVSHDGSKLYVSGVGDTMHVYDAETLEPIKEIFAGGDFMLAPIEVPTPASPSPQ